MPLPPAPSPSAQRAPETDRPEPARPAARTPTPETVALLRELEHIQVLLRSRRSYGEPEAPPALLPTPPRSPPPAPALESAGDRWGSPSPYLEDRLDEAHATVAEVRAMLGEMDARTAHSRASLDTLEVELARATEELRFVRGGGGDPGPAPRPLPGPVQSGALHRGTPSPERPTVDPGAGESGGLFASRPRAEAYRAFTVGTYNETLEATRARRRTLAWSTVGIAVVISAVLFAVVALGHAPMPPLWLATLPLVWMIPVPLFIGAYRGTHRILREAEWTLPGAR